MLLRVMLLLPSVCIVLSTVVMFIPLLLFKAAALLSHSMLLPWIIPALAAGVMELTRVLNSSAGVPGMAFPIQVYIPL